MTKIKRDHVIISSIMLLAAAASIALAWLIAFNSTQIEMELLNELAMDELEELTTIVTRDPGAPLPRTDMVEVWLEDHWDSAKLPGIFEELELGTHHLLELEGHTYHVLHDSISGRDAVIAIDLTPFQARRAVLRNLLIIIAFLAPIATALMAIYYLRHRLTPVISMAEKVASLEPSQRGVRLSSQFQDGEMQVIAHAFDAYQRRLDQFVEREQSFCEAASHELRTPLATLSAGTEILAAEAGSFSPRSAQTIDRMQRTARHMSSLLNGLMWLVREHETPSREVVNLGDVVNRLVEQYTPLIQDQSIQLHLDRGNTPSANLPVGHFEIVLGNILRNAIQHTPRDGRIAITFSNTAIIISDTGKGMDKRYLDQIFERDFRRRDSRGGLGLFLSQRICLYHGWKLSIQSEKGQGTSVTFDLGHNPDPAESSAGN